ncbi:FtsX-like permease family protein [Georgenia yuyongxinii]
MRPGDALLLDAPGDALPLPQFTVVVTGIFRPVDGTDDYWAADPLILAPARAPTGDGGLRRLATALVAEDGYGALTGAFAGAGAPPPSSRPEVSGALTHAWRFVWDADRLQAADAAVLTAAVGRVQTAGTALAPFPVRVSTGLADLLDTHARAVAVTRSLDSVAYAGIAALAVLSMSLTVLVGTSQRRDRLRLVRARGASLTQVSLLLAAQTLAWVVPGAVVALVVAWVLVPDGGSPVPLLLAAATVVLPLLVVPWAVRAETRALHGPPARGRLHPAARLAPELAVLALTVLGVLALRRRGLAQAGQGGVDPYAALVPTLVALAVGLVVLRLYPYPIRWAASALARGSGLTAFLGTARAARARPASALPLLVLLLAVALSVFAGTVLSTVTGEQSRAAWRAVGADLRVDDPALTAEQVAALEAAAGVTAVVPAYRDAAGSVGPLRPVTVLGADPAAFASLLAGTPLTVDLPDLGGGGGRDDPLPAAVSTAVRADAALGTAGRLIRLDPRAAVPALQRGATAGEVLVLVPLADLAAVTGGGVEPTAVLVDLDGALGGGAGGDGRAGDPGADGNAESRVEALLGPSASRDVTSREEVRAAVADAPLPAHLRRAYGGTVVLAAGYSVVSVALLLALGAAERRAAISRLRTMGMRARDVRRLPAWEVLPLTVAALLPGVAVGLALPALLGPALDLAPFTGGPAEPPLRPDPLVTVALCLLVAGAAAIAVVLDAARGRRANLSSALRIGDQS